MNGGHDDIEDACVEHASVEVDTLVEGLEHQAKLMINEILVGLVVGLSNAVSVVLCIELSLLIINVRESTGDDIVAFAGSLSGDAEEPVHLGVCSVNVSVVELVEGSLECKSTVQNVPLALQNVVALVKSLATPSVKEASSELLW